jgi:hypothetical protein
VVIVIDASRFAYRFFIKKTALSGWFSASEAFCYYGPAFFKPDSSNRHLSQTAVSAHRRQTMAPELRTERELSLDFLRVTEAAAIAAGRTMGQGDRKYSDQVAVEAMREVMDSVPMRGRIVIGEGERDEAPMLFIGEEVGGGFGVGEEMAASCPEVDIAVDPLEGTNLCALGANNAIAVLAASERGGLLHAPDIYMDKDRRRAIVARRNRYRRAGKR